MIPSHPAYDLNQGDLCFAVIESLANQAIQREQPYLDIQHVISCLDLIGWTHTFTNYRAKRKHFYEVLNRKRWEGKTKLAVIKGKIVFDFANAKLEADDDTDEVSA
jgi:hypothetical protein